MRFNLPAQPIQIMTTPEHAPKKAREFLSERGWVEYGNWDNIYFQPKSRVQYSEYYTWEQAVAMEYINIMTMGQHENRTQR